MSRDKNWQKKAQAKATLAKDVISYLPLRGTTMGMWNLYLKAARLKRQGSKAEIFQGSNDYGSKAESLRETGENAPKQVSFFLSQPELFGLPA